jgi:RND family efflux transporter MFP subunit
MPWRRLAVPICTSWPGLVLTAATGLLPVALSAAEPPTADGFPCMVEPHLVVEASTAVEGILAAVSVGKGDLVKQGDIIAALESGPERAAFDHATLRAEMKAAIAARQVNLDRSIEKYDRAQKLSGKKFVSSDDLDELRSAVDRARLELEEQEENRRLAGLEAKRMAALLEQRSIRSPITGVVVERFLSAGEFAQAQPIVKLAQLDPLNVEAVLPSALYGSVQAGSTARVVLSAPFDRTLEARVTLVEKLIDAASGTFGVRIELPNPDYRIPAGLECRVTFAPEQ